MGRPRKLLSIEEIPLVGGDLCLDFVNTTGARESGKPRERLRTYSDLVTWSCRVGILDGSQTARLRRLADAQPGEAADTLTRARELREDLYRLLRQVAADGTPDREAIRPLAAWWRRYRSRTELVLEDDVFRLRAKVDDADLDPMLWPIVDSATELLTSGRGSAVKRCGECDWLFLDESKNQSRTWCKKQCGDRVRARRHYARHGGGG